MSLVCLRSQVGILPKCPPLAETEVPVLGHLVKVVPGPLAHQDPGLVVLLEDVVTERRRTLLGQPCLKCSFCLLRGTFFSPLNFLT